MKNYNRFVLYSMSPTVARHNNRDGFFRTIGKMLMRMFNRSG